MAPRPESRLRYARHRSLPEVGEAGQARIEAAALGALEGDPRAVEAARLYLERSGVPLDVPAARTCALPDEEAIAAFGGRPGLEEAAAFLRGALVAVEHLKAALEVGRPLGALPDSLAGEP